MCGHVSEFSSALGDDIILPQGSKFEQRLFIANQDERKLVKKLANAEISVETFLNENVTSQNGQLVVSLMRHIQRHFPDETPGHYLDLLGNLSKSSPVCGFLQAASPRSLMYMKEYCRQTLDLTSAQSIRKVDEVVSDLPALWHVIDKINKVEKRKFPPRVVR